MIWIRVRPYLMMLLVLLLPATALAAPQLRILLPLGRTAYQTNEMIDVSVARSDSAPLPAGDLALTLTDADSGGFLFRFPLTAIPVVGGEARATEHYHLNGWLMRPGHYRVSAAADDSTDQAEIDIYSHVRRTSFKLIDWGSRAGQSADVLGEDSMGFNVLYATAPGDASIRGGLDYTGCCVMSGGHQMDLRMPCDWSDPAVLGGGRARVVRAALQWRNTPNLLGIHFYDEPGLTWTKDPITGQGTPHGVPSQLRSYQSAFDKDAPDAHTIDPANPDDAARWRQWAIWKLGFLDAAWKDAEFGVSTVRPDLLSLNQSQYAFTAFTDGYYFNVTRSLPIASGHGGYEDQGPGYFCPSYFLEFARARDLGRPCWYLPTWYGNTNPANYRLEQYLCFMTDIQGLAKPPDMQVHNPDTTLQADAIVETNKLMGRLGTIFTTMPPTRSPVAVLYSLSHLIHQQIKDRTMNYAHGDPHGVNLAYVYLAGKMIQQPMQPVVEEDILDGTVAATSRVVILTSITYLDPRVISGLEEFVARGGVVLTTGDTTVTVKGAINLGITPRLAEQEIVDALVKQQKYAECGPYWTTGKQLQAATPLANALRDQLAKAGVAPVFECDKRGIAAARQGSGDIEYLFAANATYDGSKNERNALASTTASITLASDGRPVYDAMLGGPAAGFKRGSGGGLTGQFTFEPGQMRVFARTSRPIGSVAIGTPVVERDYTRAQSPLQVTFSAVLQDIAGKLLSGSAPLRVVLTDSLGVARYDLYRATTDGVVTLSLPLAANDPTGLWTLSVQELLANTTGHATFKLAADVLSPVPGVQAPGVGVTPTNPNNDGGGVAGSTRRAVIFGNDSDNIFRLVRNHRALTVVRGTGAACGPAADRLARILKPWNVSCSIVNAADVNRPREIGEDEAATFCGIDYAGQGQIKPGRDNSPLLVGFDVNQPVLLLGTPQDNPLIGAIEKHKVLPYTYSADFPGRGRGMVAWQLDIIGQGIESVALIAGDAAGMAEAVGSFYEAAAGIEPLTPLVPPLEASVKPVTTVSMMPAAAIAWSVALPSQPVSLVSDGANAVVRISDGSGIMIGGGGKLSAALAAATTPVRPGIDKNLLASLKGKLLPDRIPKATAVSGGMAAVGYWGGALQTFDAAGHELTFQQLPQDIRGIVWIGSKLVVGQADGQVLGLKE